MKLRCKNGRGSKRKIAKPWAFPTNSKGFTQIDYIIATGIFLVVFALVVQYVANYFGDITATTNIRIMTTESNNLLTLGDRGFDPPEWPYFAPNDSVILYIHLDNSTLDSGRYGNHGVSIGGTNCAANISGKFDSACNFDSINNFINFSYDIFDTSTVGTISAWINKRSDAAQSIFSSASASDNLELLSFDLSSGQLRIINRSPQNIVQTNKVLNNNTWYHVAVTSNGTQWNLYINGFNETTSVIFGSNTGEWFNAADVGTNRYSIGVIQRAGGNISFFNGTIDEVIIFNRSLSAEEVRQLYTYETTVNRLGLATKAYRFHIVVNNSRQAWKDQSKAWVNITDEQIVFNYSDLGLPASVSSTTIYDDSGNNVAYNINGNVITFNTSIVTNATKNFTVYFDDDANFPEQGVSVAGNDNLTETVYPAQKVDVVQYKKILLLNNSNYTLIKNTTQTPRDFRLTLLDSSGSTVIDYGAVVPSGGNIVASRRFVVYQNSTGGIRRGTLNVQVW